MQQATHKGAAAFESTPVRDWNYGLFSCTEDIGFCLFAYCCMPCASCKLQSVHAETDPAAADATAMFCFGNVVLQRHLIRKSRNIDGNCFMDYMEVICCSSCALTQEYLELTKPAPPVKAPMHQQPYY